MREALRKRQFTVFLHIGSPKTATSSIQRAIAKLSSLEGQSLSVFFPVSFWFENPGNSVGLAFLSRRGNKFLANLLRANTPGAKHQYKTSVLAKAYDEIRTASSSTNIFCFSAENIFRANKDAVARCKVILNKLFGEDNYRLEIIAYLRRQDDFLLSFYSTHVRDGYKFSLKHFLDQQMASDYLNYYKTLSLWRDVFPEGQVRAYPFERNYFIEGNIIVDFFSRLNMRQELTRIGVENIYSEVNKSLGVFALEGLRMVNNRYERFSTEWATKQQRKFRRALAEETEGGPSISVCVSPQLRRQILERYASDNQCLYKSFFPEGCEFPKENFEYQQFDLDCMQDLNNRYVVTLLAK